MWKKEICKIQDRTKTDITFDPHVFDKTEYLNLDLDKVEETVRTGTIYEEKCEEPNKLCFKRFFGKENIMYTVIVRYHLDFIEVKTVWSSKGK